MPSLPRHSCSRGDGYAGLTTLSSRRHPDGLQTNTVDLREWRIPRQGASHAPPSCTGITWEAEYALAQPEVLACGPVPPRRWAGQAARTAGLPDGDGMRVGRPVGRTRSIAAGSPSACRRDRPAGRHYGSIRRGPPGYGCRGVRRPESCVSQPYWSEDRFYGVNVRWIVAGRRTGASTPH